MEPLSFLLIIAIVFITVSLLIVIILEVLNIFKPDKKLKKIRTAEFKSRVVALSKRELEVIDILKGVLKNKNLILIPKLRLVDIVIALGDSKEDMEELLNDLVVDLVVCDRKTGKISLTIEIVDSKEEKLRAGLIEKILKNADIPLILLNSRKGQDMIGLAREIEILLKQ